MATLKRSGRREDAGTEEASNAERQSSLSTAASAPRDKLSFVEPQHRFATLREKLRVINNQPSQRKMSFGLMSQLVDEARFNRSAIIQDDGAAAAELQSLLAMPAQSRKAWHARELIEYGRRVYIPLPGEMLERQKLVAWHLCLQALSLVTIPKGERLASAGHVGKACVWLLSGDAEVEAVQWPPGLTAEQREQMTPRSRAPLPTGDVPPLGRIDEAALALFPSPTTAVARTDCVVAALSAADYAVALERAACTMLSSSHTSQLKQLLLNPRASRTPTHIKDIDAKIFQYEPFHSMDDALRQELCSIMEYVAVPAGATLFEQGDRVCFLFVVMSGVVRFTQKSADGGEGEVLGTKTKGDHFGTVATLIADDQKRPFTAVADEPCEFIVINRVAYSRLIKHQLSQKVDSRMAVIRELAVLKDAPDIVLKRVAFNSSTEVIPTGQTLISPACYPSKVYLILEGECKLMWMTDDLHSTPPSMSMSVAEHQAIHHPGLLPGSPGAGTLGERAQGDVRDNHTAGNASDDKARHKAASSARLVPEASAAASDDADDSAKMMMHQVAATASYECGCGVVLTTGASILARCKHSIEVSRLSRGDVVNAEAAMGQAPSLSVIAATPVVVMSIDADSVESVFGAAAWGEVTALLQQKRELASERLSSTLAVRKHLSLGGATGRSLVDDPDKQTQFLEHFVPAGPSNVIEGKPSRSGMPTSMSEALATTKKHDYESITHAADRIVDVAGPLPATFEAACVGAATRTHHAASAATTATGASTGALPEGCAAPDELPMVGTSTLQWPAGALPAAAPPPRRPAATFAGNMHATLGDMMEMLGPGGAVGVRSVPGVAATSTAAGKSLVHASTHRGGAHTLEPLPPSVAKHGGGGGGGGGSAGGAAGAGGGSGGPPGHSATAAVAASPREQGVPGEQDAPEPASPQGHGLGDSVLSSPVMLARARLQPVTAPATARLARGRDSVIVSVGAQGGDGTAPIPQLGAAPPSRGGPAVDDVAIMPGNLTTYESVLRPIEKQPWDKATTRRRELAQKTEWGAQRRGMSDERQQRITAQLKRIARKQAEKLHAERKARGELQDNANGWVEVDKVPSAGALDSRPSSRGSDMSMARIASGKLGSTGLQGGAPGGGDAGGAGNTTARAASGRMASGRKNNSFRVRSVRAWHRPDEEFALPLDRDALAPSLRDHPIRNPNLGDIHYILNRWGDRWASDREHARQQREAEAEAANKARSASMQRGGDEEELWDLDLFGAPTFGPGL